MYSGPILPLRRVHVVVVAERDADAGGGEAVDVVDGGLARAAGHEGALVLERLVALREVGGLRLEEVGQAGVEDARAVADADDRALALRGVRLHRGASRSR